MPTLALRGLRVRFVFAAILKQTVPPGKTRDNFDRDAHVEV
jgi:hypothetical protein